MDCLLINGYGIDQARVGLPGSRGSKMEDKAAREDACREYQSSLEDLTFNSKPHINMLTILAEENLNFAKDIVAIIEAQISKAPSTEKLPVLYLVDSIVKNVGGEYLAVFAKNLITSFICVFEKVDENTRKSLFKLRSTWDDVFPLKKLYLLDVRVNSMDPAWPIKPLPPTVNASIHVNPKFLKQAGGFVMPTPTPVAPSTPPKTGSQTAPVVRPWVPVGQTQTDAKVPTRDPRLNRSAPPAASQPKEQPAGKKDGAATPEKSTRPEKARTPKKEVSEDKDKSKSKSPSPLAKSVPSKTKQPEAEKSADSTKKDPRLKKRTQDKSGDAKDDEQKEKKRCTEKKEREGAARGPDRGSDRGSDRGPDPQRLHKGKLVNGSVTKHDRDEPADKPEFKTGGNARTHARKRTRSRSRSRSPAASPKRKDRRSPKSRARSSSLSPSPSHKASKPRRVRADEPDHGKPRDPRPAPKKNQSESRRSKRPAEDRHSESRESHSPRSHDAGGKDAKDAPHRWRSGWEENKHTKLPEEPHLKPSAPQRHKQHSGPPRPTTPRTPKHRLSVDANLQIPEVLNSASKKDLLRRASKRLESGEITEEDFLNMAHKIKHFFQYQEEKQQRSDSWDDSADFPAKKPPLLTTPAPAALPRPLEDMDPAELSYYEHKSKLRKTQVTHRTTGEEWEAEESPEEGEDSGQGEKTGGGRGAGHPPSHKYSRVPRDRQGERRSKEREEPRAPLGPMIEEYHHGAKEFPPLKSLPGLRFRRRADPRESSEREWTSPLTERQREEQKSGYDAPRRFGPPADSRLADPRRSEGAPPAGATVLRNCPSPAGVEAPRFERERLSPLHQKDSAEMSPVPRFESPNSEHSDDGPLEAPPLPPPPKSILKVPGRSGPLSSVRQHSDSPGHTPPHDGGHPPARYEGPGHMGPSRPHAPGWYEGSGPVRYEDSSRFEAPHHAGPSRFDGGPPHHNLPERFEGPHMSLGPVRGGDSISRLDGPPHPQGPGRFDGPISQQPPVRFEGPIQRFEGPLRFDNNMALGPGAGPIGFQQPRPLRFDGPPNQMGPMRFENPSHMRFDGPVQPGPRFDLPNVAHQGGPPLYEGPLRFPQHNLQPPMRPLAPPIYDSPLGPQQNFNMGPQRFPEPLNPQFQTGPMAFPAGPNLQPGGSFNMQPGPPFSQPGPGPFYNPAAPAVSMPQPVNLLGNPSQPFLPQSSAPFTQTPQVVPTENHFGQVDVNDLLTKLISTGIIKPSQPDAAPAPGSESASVASAAPPAVEEEEEEAEEAEEDEDVDVPDLTSFSLDDMKLRYESVVTKLYSGNQCCLCSMRFTAAQTDMYADHLDWHFRQNHAGKVASKKITHRRWYYTLRDWIEFEEIADLEERAKSQFFEKENEEEVQKSQAAAKEKEFQSVKATKDQVGESCEICQEPFETYWVEEEEDWFLKNAVRVDDKNFHPACFEDYKNTSYLDVTPSPNKLLSEHPLSAFIKTEAEEEGSSCVVGAATASAATASAATASAATATASVKQEVDSEASELPAVKKEEEEVLTDEVQCAESRQ